MADVLPGYRFDNGRYRDETTGRFVSRSDISNLLDAQIQSTERRFGELARAFHEGKIAPAVWAEQMGHEARRLALQNAALAKGGFDRLTQSDYGRAGQLLRNEYQRIIVTARDVQAGTVTLPQLLNRVNGYAGDARTLYFRTLAIEPHRPIEGMTLIERRTLAGDAQHCPSCLRYYEDGWQISVVPPGTECECGSHCRCGYLEREVPTSDLDSWLGTKR